MTSTALFQPLTLGPGLALQHRVVLAPLTRFKADKKHVPLLPLVKDYYTQRGSRPGTLLVTESTYIAHRATGFPHMPGIYSPEQIVAWKEVTASVHAKGSYIFLQLLALGRSANPAALRAEDASFPFVGPSDIPMEADAEEKPRPMTVEEIKEYVELYVLAAKNAMEAGFDGVEIHNSNGDLLDQFIQDISNNRTDAYGGSIENRARMMLEVVKAISDAIGEERVAVRFSPWSPAYGMGMKDPIPTFSYAIQELQARHPNLAYVHLIEPRISASEDVERTTDNAAQSNEPLAALWKGPLIRAGGLTRESALKLSADRDNLLVAFGRTFIANPDLPLRLEKDIPLHPYDRSTFYLVGEDSPRGYTDQPFAEPSTN